MRQPVPDTIEKKVNRNRGAKLMPSPFRFARTAERHPVAEIYPGWRPASRPVHPALAVDRQSQSRAGPVDDELGQHAADPAEHGLVAHLRAGQRQPEPARLRRPLSRQAGRRPAAVGQQLPAGIYQGTHINNGNLDPKTIIRDVKNRYLAPAAQREQLDLLQRMNRAHLEQRQRDEQLEARIASLEMAYRMQGEAQDAFDINKESAATRKAVRGRRVRQRLPDRPSPRRAWRPHDANLLRTASPGRSRRHQQPSQPRQEERPSDRRPC